MAFMVVVSSRWLGDDGWRGQAARTQPAPTLSRGLNRDRIEIPNPNPIPNDKSRRHVMRLGGCRLAEELDRLMTRERTLNDQFEALREEYKGARDAQEAMRAKYNISGDEVARLTNELQRCEAEVRRGEERKEREGRGGEDKSGVSRRRDLLSSPARDVLQSGPVSAPPLLYPVSPIV